MGNEKGKLSEIKIIVLLTLEELISRTQLSLIKVGYHFLEDLPKLKF